MTTVKGLGIAVMLGMVLALPGAVLAQVTADDFLPPVQGGPTDVKEPSKVKVEGKVVSASTAQDAINAAAAQNAKELAAGDTAEVGAKMVKFSSGLGFVATGVGAYRTMENPTATRIAKRQSYVVAFVQAKKHLAEILGGLSNVAGEAVRQSLSTVTLPKEDLANISTQSTEAVLQAVAMMLRGFVVYEVRDDTKQNTVYVTIVTTPKTRGKLARPAPNAVEVNDLRDGLNQIIDEVKSGLVPPVGGRIVIMRSTGETAFVGFGSTVVRTNENAAVQAKLNLESQKIAAMRAKDALCGLIIGDQACWTGSVVESVKDEVKEFEKLRADDPLAKDNPAGVKKLEQVRQTFVAKMESTDVYVSARKGVLPPGVATKTWFDADHAWAFAMSVYVPSLTNVAASTAQEIMDAKILQPGDNGSGKKPDAGSGFTDEKNPEIKRPTTSTRPGPTGKVGDDRDL
jgi:hypothetical protein